MNYYKRHLGDYAKDTKTLSIYEHGVYAVLLDEYYTQESALCDSDIDSLICPRNPKEYESLNKVLKKYFKREGETWRHSYAERVITAAREKAEKNRLNGSRGGRPTKDETETVCEQEPKNNPDGYFPEPKNNLSHKPLATSHKKEEADRETDVSPACPYSQIIELYHAKLPELPTVQKLTTSRKGHIQQRWREDLKTLDEWGNYFDFIRRSPFLMGRVPGSAGRKPFRKGLEWFVKPENFAKVAEDYYHHG